MLHNIKHALLAAWWAVRHYDDLTMLIHEMTQDAAERNSNGRHTLHSLRTERWLNRYLISLPIR